MMAFEAEMYCEMPRVGGRDDPKMVTLKVEISHRDSPVLA
jgi:hypothetical protein